MHRGLALLRGLIAVVTFGIGAVAMEGVAAADSYSPALELHLDALAGGTTPDSSPNDLSAAAQGTLISDGRFDNALRLSSDGDSVNVANTSVLAPDQVTVMAWVRHSGWPDYDKLLVGKPYASVGCYSQSYGLASGLQSGVRFVASVNEGQGSTQISTPLSAESTTSGVWDGQWHAIAGTYDGNFISLYEDGNLVGSTQVDGSPPILYDTNPADAALDGLYVGRTSNPNNCATDLQYSGDIDEVRVYDRALSAQEIATLQDPNATTPPELAPPVVQPTVLAAPADGLFTQGATLHGTVTPNGSTVTDCHFEYGTSAAYGASVPCAQSVGGGTTGVPVSASVSGLSPDTTYDFELVATSAGGTSSNTGTFTTPVIDTAITSGPAGPTNNPTPAFGFTADPAAGATFVCSVDHGSSSACSSPFTTGHLPDGPHEFEVTAVTAGGTADPTPATRSFFVDTVAPQTSPQVVGGSRVGQSNNIHGAVELFATATDPAPSAGGVHTRCEYAGAGTPGPASYALMLDGCAPQIVSQPGSYVFYGASVDAAGNVEAVRSVAFTLLAGVEVRITSGPSGDTWEKQPSFAFTSSTPGAKYFCQIDHGGYVACQSPWLSPAQDPGKHAFYVKAVAPDGTQSNVDALYYTIQAPRTDPASEPHTHCTVNPFVVDPTNPNGGNIIGCGFGHCPPRVACSPAIDACPTGAICTLRFTSHFADDDPTISFALLPICQSQATTCLVSEMDDDWEVLQRFGALYHGRCDAEVLDDPKACDASTSETVIGSNLTISPICYARILGDLNNPLKPGDLLARDFGPDSSRHLDCDATESIAPATALDLSSVPTNSYTNYMYVPAAGSLALTEAETAAFAARSKRPAQPGIGPIKITVTHPGAVLIRFRLNSAAKRVLARRHKFTLRVKIVLSLPHQAAITRMHAVTFTQPAKPPSARQRRHAARRLCLRKHPRATRTCNRL